MQIPGRWHATILVIVAGLAVPAFVACGGSGAAVTPTPTHSVAPSPSNATAVSSATSPECDQKEQTTPDSGDAWAQAAAAIGNPSIVLKPASVPSGFGDAKLDSTCNSGGAAGYTVTYTGSDASLFLCLDRCWLSNTPGPPAYTGTATIRHEEASVLMTAGMGNGTAFSYYQIAWKEGGRRYFANLADDSNRLTFTDLKTVVTSLAPMAGSESPTAQASGTAAASSATPVPAATPEQCSQPSPVPSEGDAWAQVVAALGNPAPVLRPASVPSAFGEPRIASICNTPGAPEYTVVYGSGNDSLVLCISSCAGAAAFPGTPDSVATLDIRGTTASVLALPQPEGSTAAAAYEIHWFENQQAYSARLVSNRFKFADLEAIVTALAPPK